MANNLGLWLSSFQAGLEAEKPTLYQGEGNIALWFSTDTGILQVATKPAADAAQTANWNSITGGGNPLQLPVMTVSGGTHNLPAAAVGNKGQMAYVTDLNSIAIGATAAHGSTGAAICVSNGTNWIVGGVPTQA
jgi:hypothetical protein